MEHHSLTTLKRNVEATLIPAGARVLLLAGEQARVAQSLGGSYTVVLNGNLFRIDGKDADALGLAPAARTTADAAPRTREELEKQVWEVLRTCYDPEIPVTIVDLGLVYDCQVTPLDSGHFRVDIKMTLTTPGCGMGPVLQADVQQRVRALDQVDEVNVALVWDPPWTQRMMTEAARLQLGVY